MGIITIICVKIFMRASRCAIFIYVQYKLCVVNLDVKFNRIINSIMNLEEPEDFNIQTYGYQNKSQC